MMLPDVTIKNVPPHGTLCCQRLGLPPKAAKMLAKILNSTICYLKTRQVVSARTYYSDKVIQRYFKKMEGEYIVITIRAPHRPVQGNSRQ